MPVLETKRLTVERLTKSSISCSIGLWTDPEVTQYMGGPREIKSLKEALNEELKKQPSKMQLWPVFLKEEKKYVGDCGLIYKTVDQEQEVEIVYMIQKNYWNQGLATEVSKGILDYAFNQLNEKKVIALIHPENPASEKVAIKLGMRLEKETLRPSGIKMKVYRINKTDFIFNL